MTHRININYMMIRPVRLLLFSHPGQRQKVLPIHPRQRLQSMEVSLKLTSKVVTAAKEKSKHSRML